MFLMVASLTMFTLGCGTDKKKDKPKDEKPAAGETEKAK